MPMTLHKHAHAASAHRIARCAVRALYAEVALEPKPGLVSFRDTGSHADMSASTFFKSLFALRHYFGHIACAGMAGQPFETLQALGCDAEARMLAATGGINTHRGAVFSLGLLCSAAGLLRAQGQAFTSSNLRATLLRHWGHALRARADLARRTAPTSNGQRVAQCYRLRCASDEAAEGFPTLFEVALPALDHALAQGHPLRSAKVQSLFATMAFLDDTNVAHRGGHMALQFVKEKATNFLAEGGVAQPDWLHQARKIHSEFVAQRLSPGGVADVMACVFWLNEMRPPTSEKPCALTTKNEQACV